MHRRTFLKGTIAGALALGGAPWRPPTEAQLNPSAPQTPVRTLPIELGTDKQVFLDWWFIEPGYGVPFTVAAQRARAWSPLFMPRGVRLTVVPPLLSPEPILVPDTPADGLFIGAYCTLLYEDGVYRLWYEGYETLQSDEEAKICYAESTDGRRWIKPKLGLIEYKGSRENNIVLLGAHGATIFKDPSAPPSERYKLLYVDRATEPDPTGTQPLAWLFGAVSPDGLRWTRLREPVLKHTSDTQNVCLYDVELKRYVAYVRGWEPQTRAGFGGRRVVKRTEAADFRRFADPEIVLMPAPDDPPDVDIYTNAYHRWPGAARAHLMLPAFYHRAADTVEVHLAVSRDGRRWFRPRPHPYIPVGPPGSGAEGQVYAGVGIVPWPRGQWAFPVARLGLTHNLVRPEYITRPLGGIWLAILREDGFMALEAETEGECWTQVVSFTGGELRVNFWSHRGGRLRVGLVEPDGTPIPGYATEECDGVEGDVLWEPIRWKGRSDCSTLRGKLLRIHFHIRRGRLYAFRFA
ncbi:hypothetical protein HRbin10_02702 [bacterium HR10]|uniref:Hypothetical conserved protein n=1 Tax=uncultured Acidobacteriota bacterium TaxID=171953 RepID=H5SCF1_9BACT|nr:hypothetical conserved protein [uncultured Acidobacteriota bacterium]GBC83552.1 hypothetical protein HRbin10_02702 [bacterium HR10]